MRFTLGQYNHAIANLEDAAKQLAPDGSGCVVCGDSGHQAWECGHNPLLAVAICEDIAKRAHDLHERIHALPDDQKLGAELCDRLHDFLHYLAGWDSHMGMQTGPARCHLPDLEYDPARAVRLDPGIYVIEEIVFEGNARGDLVEGATLLGARRTKHEAIERANARLAEVKHKIFSPDQIQITRVAMDPVERWTRTIEIVRSGDESWFAWEGDWKHERIERKEATP